MANLALINQQLDAIRRELGYEYEKFALDPEVTVDGRCPTCEDRWTTGTECSRCSDGIVWAAEGHWLQRAVGAASSALTGFAAAFGWTAPEPF